MDNKEAQAIVELSASCDQGQALHRILDLLVDADFDDHLQDETVEEYEQRAEAEAALFLIACAWSARKKALTDDTT